MKNVQINPVCYFISWVLLSASVILGLYLSVSDAPTYHLVGPLILSDLGLVLLNFGWICANMIGKPDPPKGQ